MSTNGREWKWLERDRMSVYRQLSIKGRRIKARTLYGLTVGDDPITPEEVADAYDVPLDAVREAIEYCESDPPEIREDWEDEERSIADAERRQVPGFRGPKWISARLKELGMESEPHE